MPFPFTFKLSVPGLFNPFSSVNERTNAPKYEIDNTNATLSNRRPIRDQDRTRRRPSPVGSHSLTPQIPRKRGWEPAFAEPSHTATTLASPSGYLDTPAKYRQLAASDSPEDYHEIQAMPATDPELPPTKRRRGLAGSIVSGALSAALIGAAVGVTVYRLWRDHGKVPEQGAPPPYQEAEWKSPEPLQQPKVITVTPATPRGKKTRNPTASISKRTPRKQRPRVNLHPTSPQPHNAQSLFFPPVPAHFNFEQQEQAEEDVEDQMDWIGSKLSVLIEEGKKALGREVVVMSEAVEDEVDDGNGSWEEEEQRPRKSLSRSRTASPRRKRRPNHVALPPPSYASHPPSASPRSTQFDFNNAGTSSTLPMGIPKSMPSTSHSSPVSSFREDPSSWASPELRESMERARAMALKTRGL